VVTATIGWHNEWLNFEMLWHMISSPTLVFVTITKEEIDLFWLSLSLLPSSEEKHPNENNHNYATNATHHATHNGSCAGDLYQRMSTSRHIDGAITCCSCWAVADHLESRLDVQRQRVDQV
jgi:hypothetical protein